MSDTKAAELGLKPLARIVSTGVSGLSPEIMGLGPVEASKRALANAGMSIGDIDLVEINEAFAAQVVPSYQRSEEHTSELQSLMRISYAVFCLKKKKKQAKNNKPADRLEKRHSKK